MGSNPLVKNNKRNKGGRVRIGKNRIWVNGEVWIWNNVVQNLWEGRKREVDGREKGEGNMNTSLAVSLNNKDRGFWEELKKWDVIMMNETWMDEKD